MSLDNIITRILQEANAKAEALRKDADAKAEEISRKAKEGADLVRDKILNEAKLEAKAEVERTYSAKNLEIRKEILKKKKELMNRSFDETFRSLLNVDDKDYMEVLEKMISDEAKKGPEAEIQFSKRDAKRITKEFIENLNKKHSINLKLGPYLEIEDMGFILKRGKIITDCTFSKGLKILKDRLQFEVAKILFS